MYFFRTHSLDSYTLDFFIFEEVNTSEEESK